MRLIFGVIIGIALTVGAAWIHDSRLAGPPPGGFGQPPGFATGQLVNWDLLGTLADEQVRTVRGWWDRTVGG